MTTKEQKLTSEEREENFKYRIILASFIAPFYFLSYPILTGELEWLSLFHLIFGIGELSFAFIALSDYTKKLNKKQISDLRVVRFYLIPILAFPFFFFAYHVSTGVLSIISVLLVPIIIIIWGITFNYLGKKLKQVQKESYSTNE